MTNIQKRAPQHGGIQRVAFDGGTNCRGELPFQALSVNIDNWSPYWYKLNPIEEYIPPFQHGVNVRLPLIHSYEFVCQSPPGIAQSTIVLGTGIAGNTTPLIAIFSSFDTNNDAGFSALEASSNLPSSTQTFVNVASFTFDVTLYDGLFLEIHPTAICIVNIFYNDGSGNVIFMSRILHAGSNIIFTLPKITKQITVTFVSDPIRGGVPGGTFIAKPFIGALSFDVQLLTQDTFTPAPRDTVATVGEQTVSFSVNGLDNAVIVIMPNGGAGVTVNTVYWVKVFIAVGGYSNVTSVLLYSRAFINPTGTGGTANSLVLPLSGLLAKQVKSVSVFIRPSEAGAILATGAAEIALHQNTAQALDTSDYDAPVPYVVRFQAVTALAPVLITTLPVGGMVHSINVSVNTAGGVGCVAAIFVGSAAAQILPLGDVAASVLGSYTLNGFKDLRLDNSFNTFWLLSNIAGAIITIVIAID
jgi:hypothetical protein